MGKKIWILNHYASNMFFDQGGRHYAFAKYLKLWGEDPVIFCCNSVHNGGGVYFQDDSLWQTRIAEEIQVPFVFVKGRAYIGNGLERILNMVDFFFNIKKAAKAYADETNVPDIIYASSAHPLTLLAGIQLARLFHVKCICEVRDLWPESFVSFKIISRNNPILIPMYYFEKKIYEHADKIIFLMEGASEYIKERGWDKSISQEKIYYINNGVDLEDFNFRKKRYFIEDSDLQDEQIFKVIYVGSIRFANQMGKLVDVAKKIQNPNIKILVWGTGDELDGLRQRTATEGISNIVFKGYVEKRFIPYIVSHANLNIIHDISSPILRFGISPNKLFEYMAAGKPIFLDYYCKYNPVLQCDAGIGVSETSAGNIARTIERIAQLDKDIYEKYCQNARMGAEQYDFKNLTKKLLTIMTEA